MESKYRCAHDGCQWVLYRDADVEIRKEHKPTGEIGRKESIVGYFPKFDQAIARMYEGMVADKVTDFNQQDIEFAVKAANVCRENVILVARGMVPNAPK